ncbi:MAG: shikimate kinase [Bacteroidia bacterium]|nr:shikimate kinase [Bacteroidia bacterium]
MKIFLIGLPGSGKSTIGKSLALELSLPFVDLDQEVEKQEGRTIKNIFKEMKEGYFRQRESQVLKNWCLSSYSFVMATGGGAPCFFDNMEQINHAGKSIFLDVLASEIARRIMNSHISERPLFATDNAESLKDRIEFMRSQRIHFYKQASITVSGERTDIKVLVEKLNLTDQS